MDAMAPLNNRLESNRTERSLEQRHFEAAREPEEITGDQIQALAASLGKDPALIREMIESGDIDVAGLLEKSADSLDSGIRNNERAYGDHQDLRGLEARDDSLSDHPNSIANAEHLGRPRLETRFHIEREMRKNRGPNFA